MGPSFGPELPGRSRRCPTSRVPQRSGRDQCSTAIYISLTSGAQPKPARPRTCRTITNANVRTHHDSQPGAAVSTLATALTLEWHVYRHGRIGSRLAPARPQAGRAVRRELATSLSTPADGHVDQPPNGSMVGFSPLRI